jgi:branched-chain amino acid transport system permease protein
MDIVPQLILNSIIAGSIYALLAMSFNLTFGATKFFNFAHGSFAVIGAYAVFYLFKTLGLPIFLAILIGILTAGVFGFIFDKIIFLPLRKRKSTNLVKLVASIGLFSIIQAVIAILWTSQFQTLSGTSTTQKLYQISSGVITQTQVVIFASAFAVFFALISLLRFTLFGKAINALSDDEEVAKIVGINTNKIMSYVFFIGAIIAGLTGILVGFDTGIEPTMGMNLFLKGVIAAIVGGIGSVSGGLLGGFVLGFVENFGIWKISGEWKDAIAFSLLILFLIFRPQGIFKR